jgi:signal transduction histidine kinase
MRLNIERRVYLYGTIVLAVVLFSSVLLHFIFNIVVQGKNIELTKNELRNAALSEQDAIIAQILYGAEDTFVLFEDKIKQQYLLDDVTIISGTNLTDEAARHGRCDLGDDAPCYYSDSSFLVYRHPLKYAGAEVGAILMRKYVAGSSLSMKSYLLGVILSTTLLTILSLFFFLRYLRKNITQPISLIKSSLNEISNGGVARMGKTKNEDINDLVDHINAMLVRIQSYQEAEKNSVALTAIGGIASHVAHDMRSPLAVLKSYVALIRPASPEDKEYADAAERSVDKLLCMADDLVDYAKASRVDRSIRSKLKDLLDNVVAELRCKAEKDDVKIKCNVVDNLYVDLDVCRMERVLVNLGVNAIQASSNGGMVVISASIDLNGDLLLSISDNGKGVASDDFHSIFNHFFTKNKKGGTGLGLSYCKQVVEAHGGTIAVDSELGKGATFTIIIPNCIVNAREAGQRRSSEIECYNRNFIIVDDDVAIRMRWRKIIECGGGVVVSEAGSLEEINHKGVCAQYDRVDVAIVDYHYEGSAYCGIDVIRFMREKGVKEVHLCTGFYEDRAIHANAIAAGADSVIPKC